MNIGETVHWRQGGESKHSYEHFMYRILCDETKTHALNWEGSFRFRDFWCLT